MTCEESIGRYNTSYKLKDEQKSCKCKYKLYSQKKFQDQISMYFVKSLTNNYVSFLHILSPSGENI